jgi:hypothetical protein
MSGGGTGGSTRMQKPGGLTSMKPKMIVKKKFQMAAPDESEQKKFEMLGVPKKGLNKNMPN